jgi:mercuric ion transport protein
MAMENGEVSPRSVLPSSGARMGVARVLSAGGILAAIGASSCCVIPFGLFSLGVSGAWIADITALEPYQPIFVVIALACLGGGFALMRRRQRIACVDGSYCARPISDRITRIGFYVTAALIVVAVLFPRLAPLFS